MMTVPTTNGVPWPLGGPEGSVQGQQWNEEVPSSCVALWSSQHGRAQSPLGLISSSQLQRQSQQQIQQQQLLQVAMKPTSRQKSFTMVPVPAEGGNTQGICRTTSHITLDMPHLKDNIIESQRIATRGAVRKQSAVKDAKLPVPPGMAETSPGLPGYDRYDFPVDRGTIRGNLAAFGFDRLRRWDEPFNYGDDFPDIGTPTDSTLLGKSKHGAHSISRSSPTSAAHSTACSSKPPRRIARTEADQSIQSASAVQQLIDSAASEPASTGNELEASSSRMGHCVTLFAIPADIAPVLEASLAAGQSDTTAVILTTPPTGQLPGQADVAAAAGDKDQPSQQVTAAANTPMGSATATSAWQLWQSCAVGASSAAPSPSLLPLPATLLVPAAQTGNLISACCPGNRTPESTTTAAGGVVLPEDAIQHILPEAAVVHGTISTALPAFTFPALGCHTDGSGAHLDSQVASDHDPILSAPAAANTAGATNARLHALLVETAALPAAGSGHALLLSDCGYTVTLRDLAQQIICHSGSGLSIQAGGNVYSHGSVHKQADNTCSTSMSCLDQLIMQAVPFVCDSVAAGLLIHADPTCVNLQSHTATSNVSHAIGEVDRLYGTCEIWDVLDDMINSFAISRAQLSQSLRFIRSLCNLAIPMQQSTENLLASTTAAARSSEEIAADLKSYAASASCQVTPLRTVCMVLEKALIRRLKKMPVTDGQDEV